MSICHITCPLGCRWMPYWTTFYACSFARIQTIQTGIYCQYTGHICTFPSSIPISSGWPVTFPIYGYLWLGSINKSGFRGSFRKLLRTVGARPARNVPQLQVAKARQTPAIHGACIFFPPTFTYFVGALLNMFPIRLFIWYIRGVKKIEGVPPTSFASGKNDFPGKKFLVLNSFPTMSRWHLFRHCVKNPYLLFGILRILFCTYRWALGKTCLPPNTTFAIQLAQTNTVALVIHMSHVATIYVHIYIYMHKIL